MNYCAEFTSNLPRNQGIMLAETISVFSPVLNWKTFHLSLRKYNCEKKNQSVQKSEIQLNVQRCQRCRFWNNIVSYREIQDSKTVL